MIVKRTLIYDNAILNGSESAPDNPTLKALQPSTAVRRVGALQLLSIAECRDQSHVILTRLPQTGTLTRYVRMMKILASSKDRTNSLVQKNVDSCNYSLQFAEFGAMT